MPSDDTRIGEAIDSEIQNHADTAVDMTILDRSIYWRAYNYSDSMLLDLLNSNQFEHASNFNWTIRIFEKSGMKTAFALPGGYIYLSKDLLMFLVDEAEFSGLLAHEMMVADSRIITEKLKEEFSISYLLDVALGGQVEAAEAVINNVLYNSFDIDAAATADSLSRAVICMSDYDIRSYASFIERAGTNNTVEWVDLYPCDSDWSADIYSHYNVNNCIGEMRNQEAYDKLKMSISK
jgi:predicted Zn-dependent protease